MLSRSAPPICSARPASGDGWQAEPLRAQGANLHRMSRRTRRPADSLARSSPKFLGAVRSRSARGERASPAIQLRYSDGVDGPSPSRSHERLPFWPRLRTTAHFWIEERILLSKPYDLIGKKLVEHTSTAPLLCVMGRVPFIPSPQPLPSTQMKWRPPCPRLAQVANPTQKSVPTPPF